MFEVFIALLGVPFIIYKCVSTRQKESAFNARQEGRRKRREDAIALWEKSITDDDIERWAFNISKDINSVRKHAKEIDGVLVSEFGANKNVTKEVLTDEAHMLYDSDLEVLVQRILMANRGKLRKLDAVNGFFISYNKPNTWRCHMRGYSEEKMACWIQKQLIKHGSAEDLVLESRQSTDLDGTKYYRISGTEDMSTLISRRALPGDIMYTRKVTVSWCETLLWEPAVVGNWIVETYGIAPIDEYNHWK